VILFLREEQQARMVNRGLLPYSRKETSWKEDVCRARWLQGKWKEGVGQFASQGAQPARIDAVLPVTNSSIL
jgi:hypothetical protein